MQRYKPSDFEKKWQDIWDETGIYTTDLDSTKPKYIAMSMFNYPSGNLHIGHAMNFTISDVKARFKRQQGFETYHPVGWDSFGLPAENRAIKEGMSPQQSMAQLIPQYHKAYKTMGWSNDWEKEISTHLPEYYKWTQWIFWKMHEQGLAYQESRMQWWCESCQTVLANEQIVDGKCWRHDGPDDPQVQKKEVKQWFFKITEYADELLEATDDLDWTESVKLAQKNWIGKSQGAEIDFQIENSDQKIRVFTTRPDTLYGATFMVVAPEHEMLASITADEHREAVDAYKQQSQLKSELDRMAEKDKTGVFTGAYAINPINGEKLPIWTADYVLVGYGTGAIMAVPAHDERDEEFAKKYDLQIVSVIENDNLINSGEHTGQDSTQAKQSIVEKLAEQGVAEAKTNFKMRDWSVGRQRYWGAPIPIIHCEKCGPQRVPEQDLPVILPELDDFKPAGDGRSALARAKDWLVVDCPNCGQKAERETDTLDTYICSSWYMLRYMDPHNQQQIFDPEIVNKWSPVDFYNGGDHATAHLLYARFITRFFTKIGLLDNPEPFKQMLFNGKVMASDGSAFSKSKGNGIDPLEIINSGYGADALRTYLMFAAPLEFSARWDSQGVPGTHRFLSRLWNLTQEFLSAEAGETSQDQDKQLKKATHQAIKKMTEDLERNSYNTAIASAMGAVNELYKLKAEDLKQSPEWKEALENMVAIIAPFAPHTAEELWHQLGHSNTIHKDSWPTYNEHYLEEDTVTLAVQVNGKLRGEIQVPSGASEETAVDAAKTDEKVAGYLEGQIIRKIIFVPNKLISFVAN